MNLGMVFLTDIDESVILTFLAPLGIRVSLALPFLLTLESYCFTFSSHLEPLPPQMPHLSDFTGDPIICVKCKLEVSEMFYFFYSTGKKAIKTNFGIQLSTSMEITNLWKF